MINQCFISIVFSLCFFLEDKQGCEIERTALMQCNSSDSNGPKFKHCSLTVSNSTIENIILDGRGEERVES